MGGSLHCATHVTLTTPNTPPEIPWKNHMYLDQLVDGGVRGIVQTCIRMRVVLCGHVSYWMSLCKWGRTCRLQRACKAVPGAVYKLGPLGCALPFPAELCLAKGPCWPWGSFKHLLCAWLCRWALLLPRE